MLNRRVGLATRNPPLMLIMLLQIPEFSLIILIGAVESGQSTFAQRHFQTNEILSLATYRALITDQPEEDPRVTHEAIKLIKLIAEKRLAAAQLTVIDAPLLTFQQRQPFVALARQYHTLPIAIVFEQHLSLSKLKSEGFKKIIFFNSPQDVESSVLEKIPLRNNLKHRSGPFDLIGDVHGCFDELVALLEKLDYQIEIISQKTESTPDDLSRSTYKITPPPGRRAIFLGDLVDRGPKTPQVLRLVIDMVATDTAYCVPGNHDIKLLHRLMGKNIKLTHGLAESIKQLATSSPQFHQQIINFIGHLTNHLCLDGGKLIVAHAGLKQAFQGRSSGKVRNFALYGETTGEIDEFGRPIRKNWAAHYQGTAMVVYGHTPVYQPQWVNNTLCIDTGCVFGGKLTALRYPELTLISVDAKQIYYSLAKIQSDAKDASG